MIFFRRQQLIDKLILKQEFLFCKHRSRSKTTLESGFIEPVTETFEI